MKGLLPREGFCSVREGVNKSHRTKKSFVLTLNRPGFRHMCTSMGPYTANNEFSP